MIGVALPGGRVETVVRHRIEKLAVSRTIRRVVRRLADTDATPQEARALLAITLVEMSARPADARAVEWALVLPLRTGVLGSRVRQWSDTRTVGPLQLRSGPFRLHRALPAALRILRSSGADPANLDDVGLFWNGTSGPRRRVLYTRALAFACDVAGEMAVHAGVGETVPVGDSVSSRTGKR